MRKLLFLLVAMLCSVTSATTHVAILETILVAGSEDPLSPGDRRYLTDKIIRVAEDRFKNRDIQIMNRDLIRQMLPPGKSLVDCEGECLAETGRNISADYVFQATMSKVSDGVSLRGELHSASDDYVAVFNIVGIGRIDLDLSASDSAAKMFDNLLVRLGFSKVGISDLSMGDTAVGFEYTLNVSSEPLGAGFSVDSATPSECNKTPCSLKLVDGTHYFRFHAPKYLDLDTSFFLKSNESRFDVRLKPNFGWLRLEPRIEAGIGSEDDFEFTVDGVRPSSNVVELMPGRHKVTIENPCYEPTIFAVTMARDSVVTFNSVMRPLMGRLEMTANKEDRPVKIPVFVGNAKQPYFTPFNRNVPVCAEIRVGREREKINVNLKPRETVSYEYNYRGIYAPLASDVLDKRDSSVYPAISVGNQDWLVRNLGYKAKKDTWCYSGDKANCEKFGRLYTWKTAKDACPVGWKLPSALDIDSLFVYIGDNSYAGNSLKSCEGWESDGNGSDDFGFTALPAGYRNQNGSYYGKGKSAYFWLSDEVDKQKAKKVALDNLAGAYVVEDYKDAAYSVRCIRDRNYVDVDTLCKRYSWSDQKGSCLMNYDVATKATASKTLNAQGDNDYNAMNLLKDDLSAWAAPFQKSVRFDLHVKPGATVYGLAILNGYRKGADSYRNNSRIRKAKIYAGKNLVKTVEFEDLNESYDIIKFDRPLTKIDAKISVEILDVYRGEKWNDVCVTRAILIGKELPSTD